MNTKVLLAVLSALFLLIGGVAFMSSTASAAGWLSFMGDDSNYTAQWVKDIERELNKKEYQAIFLNDPRTPQATVLTLMTRAARAHEANNPALAESLVREAIEVLEQGVHKGYYGREDVLPIINFIKEHVPVKTA